ncbi:MAG: SDR family oxidoreductase [Thermoleophilaceae bacterium]|nr:SDR family oxidoreductase [Thermoleophilaceae bacterium]
MSRAVVTDAASGIGRATALLLLERGATVVAADRDEAGLAVVADAGAEPVVCDVTHPADRARLVETAGPACDHLVNAAGIIRIIALEDVTEDDWERIMAVNAKALFFLCQAFVPLLQPHGTVVNVASGAGKTGSTHEAAVYGASKAAVLSVTRSFAHAYAGRGVRVNAVCPGLIDTPMNDVVIDGIAPLRGLEPDDYGRARLAAVPLGRLADPREVANVIAFLLSDASSYMTGQSVNVTGGMIPY